ncbi:Serine/threonine kinase receptor-associated protein [Plasmopara halstedii]|uniref:Serine-threonine kinase receptor-associated protein n=1 Tax=Plasmopara halstedii TaxID=4781 RepID=A0A0N7L4E2_PLAHL|nr:Serine/threonine kinase receptor-associated protein [Plasmopara halstedii]CEG38427.1 Serine/threonine kinase receptor-associated protein [Plasmopara halstedii]|eukprot:XP_024574796.1 Serine/threonine kinase receptor-associated protein [Plasmopara halstedii]
MSSPSASPSSPAALRQIPIVCPGHSRPLAELHYSGSNLLISACHDKLPMLRHGDSGDWIGTFEGHKGAVWSAKLDNEAEFAATGSADFCVKIWDALTGDVVTTLEHKHVVKSVAFTLDGARLLTAGHEKLLRVYDVLSIKEKLQNYKAEGRTGIVVEPSLPLVEMATSQQIRKIAVLSDHLAATGEVDGTITIWDLDSYTQMQQFKVDSDVMDMEASRNGQVLTVAAGKQVYFFDTSQDFKLLHAFPMPISFAEEGGASLHPTESKFVAGGSDTWVRVFDFMTGELLETHKGHHGPVRCLRYSPSGDSFATGSEDGTVRIWQNDSKSAAATSVADTTASLS